LWPTQASASRFCADEIVERTKADDSDGKRAIAAFWLLWEKLKKTTATPRVAASNR
jgi:hypothetical protein